MKVLTPDEYPIQFEEEEINTIKDAIAVLNGIVKAMQQNNCAILEGGYVECPTQFGYDDFVNTNEWFKRFIEDVPYKMY